MERPVKFQIGERFIDMFADVVLIGLGDDGPSFIDNEKVRDLLLNKCCIQFM